MNAEQASKGVTWEPTRRENGEGRRHWGTGGRTPAKRYEPVVPPGYLATACLYTEIRRNTGSRRWCGSDPQPEAREGQIGPLGVADGSVLPTKPGNAGGGKQGLRIKIGEIRTLDDTSLDVVAGRALRPVS